MRTPGPYFPDPNRSQMSLTSAEVNALITSDGRGFVRDKEAVMHFVRRVRVTMKAMQDANNNLRAALETAQRHKVVGQPSTLSPMDAAKWLTSAQRKELFEVTERDALERVERQQQTLAAAQQKLISQIGELQLLLDTASEVLPDDLAEKIAAALATGNQPAPATQPTPQTPPAETPGGNTEFDDLFADEVTQ